MEIAAFKQQMAEKGWVLFCQVLGNDALEALRVDLARAYDMCRAVQVNNGIAENTDGSVHHLVGLGDSFEAFLEHLPLWQYIEAYFGGRKFILNSLGGIINLPANANYANRVHRDIRTFSSELPLMLNMLVMLDDFTLENGATFLGTGTHRSAEKPSDQAFFAASDRAVANAGSIVLFNSNLWHAAGNNSTTRVRRCITPTFTLPFIKQQCDYPRVLGYQRGEALSERMRQLLGYNARVPASLEEWYQPPEKRMYRPGQG